MRRSSSSSHIPVAKSEFRPRSKSSMRVSTKDNCSSSSTKKNVRTGSTEKLNIPGLKRSNSSTTLKKSLLTTPVYQSVGRPSARSSNTLVTPASSRSRSRSPYKIGSGRIEKTINDKKWVNEQFVKVQRYLQRCSNCMEHIPSMLKPPTIETFIYVINFLFKEIDPHTEINKANYKEEVLRRLKLLQYPGNVSTSLLKTVNTMHAWPQVVCIFSWLVDLINVVNLDDEPCSLDLQDDIKYKKTECIQKYVINRYSLYNEGGDETLADKEFIDEIAKVLDINEDEIEPKIKKLNEEIKELYKHKEKQNKDINDIEEESQLIQKETEDLDYQIETFHMEDELQQQEIDHVIEHLQERKLRLVEEIKVKNENIILLGEAIKGQPCTYEEKCKLLKHTEELKHTLDLKKESVAAKKESKAQIESKLTETRRKLEKNIYNLNKTLMTLITIWPELKALQFCETSFTSKEFGNEIKNVVENKAKFEDQIKTKIESINTCLINIKHENNNLQSQIVESNNELKSLEAKETLIDEQIEKHKSEITAMRKKSEEHKRLMSEKFQKFDESEPDIFSLKQVLNELVDLRKRKEAEYEDLVKETLTFFEKLNVEFMGQLEKMNEIRLDLVNFLKQCLDDIYTEEGNILQELKALSSIKDET